ncbi:MAG: class I SAM-dependent methyltransferase [Alphaproteobacteria bacterium]
MSEDWAAYYQKLRGRPPRATAVYARRKFETPGLAIDLGCGGGRDTIPLLMAGWYVVAIDKEQSALSALADDCPTTLVGQLEQRHTAMEDAEWPAADLIVSSFALPLAPKSTFPELWRRIRNTLKPGGRFAGQLYGDRDSWTKVDSKDGLLGFSRTECLRLFDGFVLELFQEEEHDGVTPRGRAKHWHIFHIVARRT